MFFGRDHRDTKVYADRGTTYPCKQAEIDVLQDRRAKRIHHRHYIDRIEATRLLQKAHDGPLSDAQKAAVKRLNDLQEAQRWEPDTIFKIFNDLDLLLFRGKLKGNVYLRWDGHSKIMNGPNCRCLGMTTYSPYDDSRCEIRLSLTLSTLATVGLRDVLSTLVHEMVHAYLGVVANGDEGVSDMHTAGHGNSFNRCARAVLKRLGPGFKDIIGCENLWQRRKTDPRWRSGFRFDGKKDQQPHGRRRLWGGW